MHCVVRLGLFCANAPARRLRVRAYGRHGPWSVWDHARIPPQRMGAAPGACWPTLRAWHARHRAHAKPFRSLGGPVEMPQGQGTAPALLPVPGPQSFPKTSRLGPEWLDPGRAGRVPCTARAGWAAQKKKGPAWHGRGRPRPWHAGVGGRRGDGRRGWRRAAVRQICRIKAGCRPRRPQPTAGLDPPTAARITGRVPAPVRPAEPPPRRRSRRAPCRECRRACSPPASSRSRAP